jgi:hypothetical protein
MSKPTLTVIAASTAIGTAKSSTSEGPESTEYDLEEARDDGAVEAGLRPCPGGDAEGKCHGNGHHGGGEPTGQLCAEVSGLQSGGEFAKHHRRSSSGPLAHALRAIFPVRHRNRAAGGNAPARPGLSGRRPRGGC